MRDWNLELCGHVWVLFSSTSCHLCRWEVRDALGKKVGVAWDVETVWVENSLAIVHWLGVGHIGSVIFACTSPSLWVLFLLVLFSYLITASSKLFLSQDVTSVFHLPPEVCGFLFSGSTKLRNIVPKIWHLS